MNLSTIELSASYMNYAVLYKDHLLEMCCRQVPEFKNCANAIPCEKTDFLYDAYLATVGMASTYTHICDNNTLSGSTAVFQLRL